jgi:hypothetical protein
MTKGVCLPTEGVEPQELASVHLVAAVTGTNRDDGPTHLFFVSVKFFVVDMTIGD